VALNLIDNLLGIKIRNELQNIITTVYTVGSIITVLATLCDHSALNGVTMEEVSSMPNVRK
jgi:hypothetical protein